MNCAKRNELLSFGYCREIESKLYHQSVSNDIKQLIMLWIGSRYNIITCGDYKDVFEYFAELEEILTDTNNLYINHKNLFVIDQQNHDIYAKGMNKLFQLGIKHNVDGSSRNTYTSGGRDSELYGVDSFTKVPIEDENIILASRGTYNQHHTFFYTNNDKLYANGNNEYGQFGNGSQSTNSDSFVLLPISLSFKNDNERIVDIRCGDKHSLFLTDKHNVYACGYNLYYNQCSKENTEYILKPKLMIGDIKEISAGHEHSLLLTTGGKVVIFGRFARLNTDTLLSNIEKIMKKDGSNLIKIAKIKSGAGYGMILDENNRCFTFGSNYFGQIGNGTCAFGDRSFDCYRVDVDDPYLIQLNDEFVIEMECGYAHSLILTNKNNVYSFGWNASKQCLPWLDKQRDPDKEFDFDLYKTNSYVLSPYHLDKEKVLKLDKHCHIQSIFCSANASMIIV